MKHYERALLSDFLLAALASDGKLTPFFIDRMHHPRMPLSLPHLQVTGEPHVAYAARMGKCIAPSLRMTGDQVVSPHHKGAGPPPPQSEGGGLA